MSGSVIWLFFGLLLGYLSAIRAGGWLDRILTGVSIAGISIYGDGRMIVTGKPGPGGSAAFAPIA